MKNEKLMAFMVDRSLRKQFKKAVRLDGKLVKNVFSRFMEDYLIAHKRGEGGYFAYSKDGKLIG